MAAVPKKKPSLTRRRHQFSAWLNKWQLPTLQKCPECGALKRTHRVCMTCGMYNGRKVLDAKTKVKKVEKSK